MRRAVSDRRLDVRVISTRQLVYTRPAPDEDRPPHVRAASGLALLDGALHVIQDDASFIARVRGDDIDAIALPHAPGGRRRFEAALGNKLDKLDLEACVVIDGALWAFGSGSLPVRETIVKLTSAGPTIIDASRLYAILRGALGSTTNIEGIARMRDELWFCHRGNTGANDLGPAIVRIKVEAFRHYIEGVAMPSVVAVDRYDLGEVGGVRIGFTDAATFGDRVFFVAAAEASSDAIADGRVLAAQIGVIAGDVVRANTLVLDDARTKPEGLVLDPDRRGHGWITADPDDPDVPTTLYEIEITDPQW